MAVAGCLSADVTVCDDGALCGPGYACAPAGGCATADQLAACQGIEDAKPCVVDGNQGLCFGGVCSYGASNCGNGIREGAEACDDGNHDSGDGCSPDCASNESCGNDIVDSFIGEQCEQDFEEADCIGIGLDYGRYGCTQGCRLATTQCGLFGFELVFSQLAGNVATLWGFDTGELVATTDTVSYHFDGSSWQAQLLPIEPTGLWGQSPTDLWATSNSDGVAHFDGSAWSIVENAPANPTSVFGTSSGEVFIGANTGLYRLEGGEFALLADQAPGATSGWANSAEDLYVVSGGIAFHYDGVNMTSLDFAALLGDDFIDAYAQTVSGTPPSNVFVATTSGLVHFDGATWQVVPGSQASQSVYSYGSDRAAGVDNGKLFDFSPERTLVFPNEDLTDSSVVFSTSSATHYVTAGDAIYRHTGSQWIASPNLAVVTAIASDGQNGYVAGKIAGSASLGVSRTKLGDHRWSSQCGSLYCATGEEVVALWADTFDFVAITADGSVFRGDSDTVEVIDGSVGTPHAIAGPAISELWAVGDGGAVYEVKTTISELSSGTTANLRDAAWTGSRVLAIGDGGTVLSIDLYSNVTTLDLALSTDLLCAFSPGAETAFVGDADGNLWRIDHPLPDPASATWLLNVGSAIKAIAGTGGTDLFIASEDGALQHWNGTVLSAVRFPVPAPIEKLVTSGNGIAALAVGRVWEMVRSDRW